MPNTGLVSSEQRSKISRVEPSARRITVIVIAVLISTIAARYDDFLPYRWQTFNAPDGSFSVQFPGKPEVADRQLESATGVAILLHQVTATPSRSISYFCVHYDEPRLATETVEEVLNSSRDSSIRNVQGRLVSEQRLEVVTQSAI